MAFPRSFLEELIARSDIFDVVSSYVHLTKKGGSYFGLCPFHNEKTPSFSVSQDKQIYHCFGCKKGGGVISFIMEQENLSYPDAVRFLAKRAGMEVPEEDFDRESLRRRQRILSLNKEAARYFYSNLARPEGRAIADYLHRRKISRKTAMDFGLGAALDSWDSLLNAMLDKGFTKGELLSAGLVVQNNKGRLYDKFRNRLMFPVIDVRGDIVAFGGRVIDGGEPKYMNTQETLVYSKRRTLYGLNLAKKTKRKNMILCEGNIDVITLHQAGFDNAVASMGTALTLEQIRLLGRYTKELILCYDNDGAGKAATEKAIALLNNSEFSVKVLELPRRLVDGDYVKQDVDDFIKYQGADAFEALLSGSGNHVEFQLQTIAAKYDLTVDKQRIEYAKEVAATLAMLSDAVAREVYATRAAETAKIPRDTMLLELEQERKKLYRRQRASETKEGLHPSQQLQPKASTLHYTDITSSQAEEGVLRLLMKDDGLFPICSVLKEEQFSSPLLGRIFRFLQQENEDGNTPDLNVLSGVLTSEEMNHFSRLLQKPESMRNAEDSLRQYIKVIHSSWQKRNEDSETDPLLAAYQKYTSKKAYGGQKE